MSYLILLRHGESIADALGVIAGTNDTPLSEVGIKEALKVGEKLATFHIQAAYSLPLQRARETTQLVLDKNTNKHIVPIFCDSSLSERNFGQFTGKNKGKLQESVGIASYQHAMNDWSASPPGGESFQSVHDRMTMYYTNNILPRLMNGNTVLVVSHHHTLKTLLLHIEKKAKENIHAYKIPNAVPLIYEYDNASNSLRLESTL